MPKSIRPSKLSAAIALWTLLQGPWVLSVDPFSKSTYAIEIHWLTAGLPLFAILAAWKKNSTLILQSVFPLSLLPFCLLVPESIQTQSHTFWTMIPIVLLWLYVICPEANFSARHRNASIKINRKFWGWFIGAIAILLTGAGWETDTDPFLFGLWIIGVSTLWICFWALIVRYKMR